jgi:hypothetical protein
MHLALHRTVEWLTNAGEEWDIALFLEQEDVWRRCSLSVAPTSPSGRRFSMMPGDGR